MEQYTDSQKNPKLLEQMRIDLRRKHYSQNTEKTYLYWVRYYIHFHQLQTPKDLNHSHIEQFLNYLAVNKHVSCATQNQALNAIVYLYRQVVKQNVGGLNYLRNARTFKNIPTALSGPEITGFLSQMSGFYGGECLQWARK
ncbi:site-specific integrase [Cellvibrio sp. PSBB006]|uniref:site-specific integrase n=1 Tax=Cellvibrio sp. PSBB006 TaxID=1987723 RepID=UPI000B3B8A85|nr:site-specific integrase [Cellvibrio sp. PSBB006]ARU26068.1 hypothetical protein CBR65_00700 [Cellvibrio sp. PSBB006]